MIDFDRSPEVFEKYDIKPGEVFVLVEGNDPLNVLGNPTHPVPG